MGLALNHKLTKKKTKNNTKNNPADIAHAAMPIREKKK